MLIGPTPVKTQINELIRKSTALGHINLHQPTLIYGQLDGPEAQLPKRIQHSLNRPRSLILFGCIAFLDIAHAFLLLRVSSEQFVYQAI